MAIQIVILVILGVLAAVIASNKGRTPIGWFFGGFFLGIIGVVIVAVLPNLKEQRERQRRQERENRRLREQLRQERIKSESFRQHTTARLDMHDNHLGLDSRQGAPSLPIEVTDAALESMNDPDPENNGNWYFEHNSKSDGPVTIQQLIALIGTGQVQHNTLVWSETLDDWTPACQVADLADHLGTV